MPELPEVETVKESLKPRLVGRKIKSVNILWDNIIAYPSKEEFIKDINDKIIIDIKFMFYLLIRLLIPGLPIPRS